MHLLPFDPCSPVLEPRCVQTVDNDDHPFSVPMPDLPAAIGGNVLDEAAESFQSAVGWLISNTASWWVKTPSPDLEAEPAIGFLQALVQPLTIAVAMVSLLTVAAKMALTRKAVPLIDAGRGLVVLAAVTVIGTVVPNLLLRWGDEWCGWVLRASSQGDFAKRMAAIVTFPSGVPAALVLVLCMIALLIGIIQALLLLFRGAALIILAGLLPLAAAGMISTATRSWFGRVAGWMLALIFYKPAAAAVYATAFTLVGNGKNLQAVLMGFAMMLISLVAFPVLLKFFTWTTGGTESTSGGGVLSALLGGATALGALRAYGMAGGSAGGLGGGRPGSANEHADYLSQQLGDQEAGPPGGQASSAPSSKQTPDGQPAQNPISEQGHDPGAPSGSRRPDSGLSDAGRPAAGTGSHGWAPPDGGNGEPVGPAGLQSWDNQRRRGRDTVRWMGNANGGDDAGGPTGAAGEGGGGGGA
ncbi:proline-rich domain-containing protein [Actinomadura sp. NPDC047616]|uniref:proline-rich domain-containing protein n=1 Tax=Actinomadura sp. NPDC047616 TaxID=3155914 RepID=UPI0033E287B4